MTSNEWTSSSKPRSVLVTLLTILLFTISLSAQESAETPRLKAFQLGLAPLSPILKNFRFEAYARLGNRHQLGLHFAPQFGKADVDGFLVDTELGRQELGGFIAKLGHRFHLRPAPAENVSFYLEHGLVYYKGTLGYQVYAWSEFSENGLNYIREVTLDQEYISERLGYEVGLGLQMGFDNIYFSIALNLSYVSKISSAQLPPGYQHDNWYNGVDFEGLRLMPAISVGINL